MIYLLDFHG
jgi:hypothetical protein